MKYKGKTPLFVIMNRKICINDRYANTLGFHIFLALAYIDV